MCLIPQFYLFINGYLFIFFFLFQSENEPVCDTDGPERGGSCEGVWWS